MLTANCCISLDLVEGTLAQLEVCNMSRSVGCNSDFVVRVSVWQLVLGMIVNYQVLALMTFSCWRTTVVESIVVSNGERILLHFRICLLFKCPS